MGEKGKGGIYFFCTEGKGLRIGVRKVPRYGFCKCVGLTIDDLTMLYGHFKERIDEKHKYQHEVYKAYVENNGLYLTDKQRDKAYKVYKVERPEYFSKMDIKGIMFNK